MRQSTLVEVSLLISIGTLSVWPSTGFADDSQAIYKKRCGECHSGSAEVLVRDKLAFLENKIVTRKQQYELRDFLKRHGRATSMEADHIYALLQGYAMATRTNNR